MNKEVSYKLAVLLKEKGYNISTGACYFNGEFFSSENLIPLKYPKLKGKEYKEKVSNKLIFAPAIADVVMWLYENHEIWITVTSISQESWQCHMCKKGDTLGKCYLEDFYTPTEAYEAAIIFTLKTLI